MAYAAPGIYGQIRQGQYAAKQGKYMSDVYKQEAAASKKQTQFEYLKKKNEIKQFMASQRATFGAMGIDSTTGTGKAIAESTLKEGGLDLFAIMYGGKVAETKALNYAQMYKAEGRNAQSASWLSAAGTLLQEGAQAALALI